MAVEPQAPKVAAAAECSEGVELDELRVVVGVGPAIESCAGGSDPEVGDMRDGAVVVATMLTDARPGLAVDDSASWPLQARLLAEGRWADFKALTEDLAAGRPMD